RTPSSRRTPARSRSPWPAGCRAAADGVEDAILASRPPGRLRGRPPLGLTIRRKRRSPKWDMVNSRRAPLRSHTLSALRLARSGDARNDPPPMASTVPVRDATAPAPAEAHIVDVLIAERAPGLAASPGW